MGRTVFDMKRLVKPFFTRLHFPLSSEWRSSSPHNWPGPERRAPWECLFNYKVSPCGWPQTRTTEWWTEREWWRRRPVQLGFWSEFQQNWTELRSSVGPARHHHVLLSSEEGDCIVCVYSKWRTHSPLINLNQLSKRETKKHFYRVRQKKLFGISVNFKPTFGMRIC